MKKDIGWLRNEISNIEHKIEDERHKDDINFHMTIRLNGGLSAIQEIKNLINQLDKPEVLSQEWIDKNVVHVRGLGDIIEAEAVENLLVPERELPVIPKFVADWIEENHERNTMIELSHLNDSLSSQNMKKEHKLYFWIKENFVTFAEACIAYPNVEVEKEQKYYALVKGHEIMGKSAIKFWNYTLIGSKLVVSSIGETREYGSQLTKDEWNEKGVNDGNADFVKVEEMEEC